MTEDRRMHFRCGECDTNFSTEDVFPTDVKRLAKLVRETKCPTCGAGAKKLYLLANVSIEENQNGQ